jgi:hypothetical protein
MDQDNRRGLSSSFSKFMTQEETEAIIARAGASEGDVVLIISDADTSNVLPQLGNLRNELAEKLNLIPRGYTTCSGSWNFPFFEYDKESGKYVAMHHPLPRRWTNASTILKPIRPRCARKPTICTQRRRAFKRLNPDNGSLIAKQDIRLAGIKRGGSPRGNSVTFWKP